MRIIGIITLGVFGLAFLKRNQSKPAAAQQEVKVPLPEILSVNRSGFVRKIQVQERF